MKAGTLLGALVLAVLITGAATATRTTFPGPNGAIAYTVHGAYSEDLCVMNPDGSRQRRLTRGPRGEVQPAWTADGTRLAFSRGGVGGGLLQVMTVKDGRIREPSRTSYPVPSYWPTWSPEGRRIAFSAPPSPLPGPSSVYVLTIDGPVTWIAEGVDPDWSPDGTKIAFTGQNGIAVVDADGTDPVVVANGSSPSWSPDGHRIAFLSGPHPRQDIYVVDSDGSDLRRLTTTELVSESGPAWSPDGRRIAFARGEFAKSDLWVMNADGTGERRLTKTPFGEEDPAWRRAGPTEPRGLGQSCAPSIVGNDRRGQILRGTAKDDAIYGLGGSDRIYGRGGRDYLSGGAGTDLLAARDGSIDELTCGPGSDRVMADRRDRVARDCERVKRS